jgi:hypothetical protein
VKARGKNGKAEWTYHLEKVGRGAYKLDAENGEDKSSVQYASKDPLGLWGSKLIESRIARDVVGGKVRALDYERFDVDNRTSFETVHATLESRQDRTVRLTSESMVLLTVVDKAGRTSRVEATSHDVAVVLTRVFPADETTGAVHP